MKYHNADPKPKKKKGNKKRKIDYKYLKFISEQPCMICGKQAEPHHEPLKKAYGTAFKGPDKETLPLCREHHTTGVKNRHSTGRKTFYKYYGIDWRKEVKKYQLMYNNYQV